jgi:hypothetical protein
VTACNQDIFPHMLPFPKIRLRRAIDVIWAETARPENIRRGVVDATPVEHLRHVVQGYDVNAATSRARQLPEWFGVRWSRHHILEATAVTTRL